MTTPILDLAALTAPIPGEQPAGVRLPADARKKMEDARKEFEPHPDGPTQPPIAKKPDWSAIIRIASDSLTKTSKDLLAGARLTEALTKRDGFAGLHEGLELLRLLVTDCWDRIHPIIEGPEDIESRGGPFQWLADPESGAWFPSSVGRIPLVRVNGHVACLSDCKTGQVGDTPLPPEALRSGEPVSPTLVADVDGCLKEIEAIDQALVEKMADQAPTLSALRDTLTECQTFLGHLNSGASDAGHEEAASAGSNGAMEGQGRSSSSGATGRADAYRQLARLADDLSRLEPHSPIPDLLRWAVKLGNMPFRELIQELIREPVVLADLRRQFGINEPAPPSE